MKDKVGIITYHRAINYGALLQAYALQSKLREYGVESEVLDYRNETLEKKHMKRNIKVCKSLKSLIVFFLIHKKYNEKHEKFREFASNYLDLSSPMYSIDDLITHECEYNLFITGSDQVWNYKINDEDPAYLLSFVKDKFKKKSYAASFGLSTIPEEHKPMYRDLLSDFTSILVREKQGNKIIKDLLSQESHVVLDPTMLLSKEQWEDQLSLGKKENYLKEKYILVYAFGGSNHIKDLAINISKKTGYRIFWIKNNYKFNSRIKYIKAAGPEDFVSLFSNAEYVITNSFHGTAFSINFNKQFFTELLPESTGVNSRLKDILDLFGLHGRKIVSSDSSVINSRIDYKAVNNILKKERNKSISLLKDAIFNKGN